ncbi:MAG TPA: hypothetical protein VGD43_15675 [Micromonospora sp.]
MTRHLPTPPIPPLRDEDIDRCPATHRIGWRGGRCAYLRDHTGPHADWRGIGSTVYHRWEDQ